MSYKKTKLIPGKAPSEEVQKEFIEEYLVLLAQAKEEEIHLLFADPTHQIHNTVCGKCWQTPGAKGTILIPSNTGRKRVNVIGAINPVSMKLSSMVTEDNCDSETMKMALRIIRDDYPDGKAIIIIEDNASYNHAVEEYAKELNIFIKFLPPYAPNLSLIERVWKFMKAEILLNTYYDTYEKFYDAIIEFCKNLSEEYYYDISKLLSQKFEIIKAG